jgi:hypothetical protein
MADIILKVTAPNLPIPPLNYNQAYTEILNNVHRLYFNRLDAANTQTITAVNNLNVMIWLGDM